MIATIHQPYYLPWLGFFHKVALSDIFVVLDDVQFEKNGFDNRNKVKVSNGWAWLTVPVLKNAHLKEQKINTSCIDNKKDWRRDHLKTLQLNYRKAKYFEKYTPFFEDLYSRKWENLSDLNFYALEWLFKTLGIDTRVVRSSHIEGDMGVKSNLVLNICKKFAASAYISGALGRNYLDEDSFRANGIHLIYQEYKHPEYPQLWGNFEPYMSIVDLLFNYGPESLDVVMSGNVSKADIHREVASLSKDKGALHFDDKKGVAI